MLSTSSQISDPKITRGLYWLKISKHWWRVRRERQWNRAHFRHFTVMFSSPTCYSHQEFFFVLFLTWTPHSRNRLSQSSSKSSFDARGSPSSLGLNRIRNFHFFFTIWVRRIKTLDRACWRYFKSISAPTDTKLREMWEICKCQRRVFTVFYLITLCCEARGDERNGTRTV